MAHFELGGSVSVDQTFQSSFAQELVKESSISCTESAYKSSFATELLESSVNSGAKISELEPENQGDDNSEENIYENVKSSLSMESNLVLDDTTDFRRCSQIFNSTMVSSSPRESLSSISRVQTVVSIAGQSSLTILDDSLGLPCRGQPVSANFNKLQHELELLQAKLNDMERSRVTYETTNQQLLSLVNKLSSQLSRNVKSSQQKTNLSSEAQPTRQKTQPTTSSLGMSSSFRRQKAIRIKKRDSVKRRVSVKGDSSSYTSSDSGNYSDIDETNNLHRLLRRGLHLVNNVNQELESVKDRDKPLEKKQTSKSSLSSSISRVDNSKKVVIKIENRGGPGVGEVGGKVEEAEVERRDKQSAAHCPREIHTNGRGTVLVPVPFFV